MATRYEYYNTNDDDQNSPYGVWWFAQTFTPTTAHKVTSVKLLLCRYGSPGTITVGIRATDGAGKPTGNDLCSGTINGNTLSEYPTNTWYEITLGAGYDLVASTKYAIVVRAPSGNSSNQLFWRCDVSSPTYAGGSYAGSGDSGSTWTLDTGTDFMFEEWGVAVYQRTASVLVGAVATASRVYGGIRPASVIIGNLATALRGLLTTTRASPTILGIVTSASKSWGTVRQSPVIVGIVASASKIWGHTRQASVIVGNTVTALRALVITRLSSTLIGTLVSASKSWGMTRASSVIIGVVSAASRLPSYIRTASRIIGVRVTAIKPRLALTRLATTIIGALVTASIWANVQMAFVSIGVKIFAKRRIAKTLASVTAVEISIAASRIVGIHRAALTLIGEVISAAKSWGRTRASAVIVGAKVTAQRTLALVRLSSTKLGIKSIATRRIVATRKAAVKVGALVSAIIQLTGKVLKMLVYGRPYRDIKVYTRPYYDMEAHN
jgi:hypothetical protein